VRMPYILRWKSRAVAQSQEQAMSAASHVPTLPGLASFERYSLTFGPSPVHKLQRLSDHLGGAQIWAKREDCNCGLAFGGNKVRKLEYIVPDVLASGADT